MKKLLKILGVLCLVAVLLTGTVLGYLLFFQGRAPAKRPDLVRLPPGIGPAPKGYPTRNAGIAAYLLGSIELLDPAFNWPVPKGVVEKKDIEYGRVGDRSLLLDLYSPKDLKKPVPGLIFIHGGGWMMGDKADYKYYTVRYADRGYVVATMGYRFSDEAKFPGCVEDAKCAVRWMRANAAELNVDPGRICLIGGSAGAHLSMMAGYAPNVPELEGNGGHEGVSSAVAAVVSLYGPTDATVEGLRDRDVALKFMGGRYEEVPEQYRMASPIAHLDANDPPTLVIQGTLDQIVPVQQADALVEKLQELGVPHYYARLEGWPHTLDAVPEVNEYVQSLINAFLDEFLKGDLGVRS